ncbi:MAG TPA: prepilin-type N-terminal cleavage/methylation domain-containing protein [Candidatus Dormibacteraeota bacterium]|nr:prepilin-type N-terminal cleavage/methylation domain-containing protein [Candidatus Dormibacteraeota bacterium]
MRKKALRYARSQSGYTLVEVIIASAIGAILMVGLTSVVFTSVRAIDTASSRVEASSQIRSFASYAYDDFARSGLPQGCPAPPSGTCVSLTGLGASNSVPPAIATHTVTYTWDGADFLDRQVDGGSAHHVASGVTAFTWSIAGGASRQTCIVQITVTVGAYSETQALQFYPQAQ